MSKTNSKTIFSLVAIETCKILSQSKIGLASIILLTILLGFRSKYGCLKIDDVQQAAGTVFQVSGTMVALILPTAQLAYTFITQYSDKFLEIINRIEADKIQTAKDYKCKEVIQRKTDEAQAETQGNITSDVNELRNNFYPSFKAIFYVFCSFLLSALALVVPNTFLPLWDFPIELAVNNFFFGAALSTLVIGSFYFIPTAIHIFKFKLLDVIQENHGKKN